MDYNKKKRIKHLIFSILITFVNGLITIFNPGTQEAASIAVDAVTDFVCKL